LTANAVWMYNNILSRLGTIYMPSLKPREPWSKWLG